MGDEEKNQEGQAQEQTEEKKGFLTKKNLIILIGLVIVLLVVSLFIVFKVLKPMVVEENEAQNIDVEKIGKKAAGIVVPLDDEFVVNVAGTGCTRYLRVKIAFEVEDEGTQNEIKDRMVQIRDMIITTLGTKKLEQLDNVVARDELKREILNKMNDLLKNGNVLNVYFTDFVVQ